MFQLWAKTFKDTHMLRDIVVAIEEEDTRTHKVFKALEKVCYEFDLSRPIWLDVTVADFKKFSRTRFYQDNFIDSIDFDYLEIQILEED